MHARYPLRKTFYREAPGGDKARMSGATAQKVRRAKELEGGEGETGKGKHGKRVGHAAPPLEQPMPPPQQAIADIPQRPQFPLQNPKSAGSRNASLGGREGENQIAGTGGSGKRWSHMSPTPAQSTLVGLQSIDDNGQATRSPSQASNSSEGDETTLSGGR